MELIKEIKDNDFPKDESTLKIREASRAVLFDENGLIPLLFVSKRKYHKLPGGGIDEGEDKLKALVRECLEEAGSEIEVLGEIGKIVEFRSKINLKQTSYCYHGNIISKGKPKFTGSELKGGFELIWVTLEDAISKIRNDKPDDYGEEFMKKRDLAFLEKAREIIKIK